MNQKRLKILWLCNCPLSDSDIKSTGTWLGAIAREIISSNAADLGIIAPGCVNKFCRNDFKQVKQWLIPKGVPLGRNGLPGASLVQSIISAVNEYSPDLVHVWGTESFWGLLIVQGLLTYPSLLEIQGLSGEIAKVFYGGLKIQEQLRCIGIKELIKRRTMHMDQLHFKRWNSREEEMIRSYHFIDVQSPWVAAHITAINPDAKLFHVKRTLRQPFYDAPGWQLCKQPVIFCSAAYTFPFKGLHVAIRALALIKKRYPLVMLRIAGDHQRAGIRQNGYIHWLNRMIRKLNLAENIEWLGPLGAEQIISELSNAAAVVIPSFIETYCVALAEAMAIGTPVVASYVGGIPSLGSDEHSCLFFPPGDEAMCAYQIQRIFEDNELAMRLSEESRKISAIRNDREKLIHRQLDIYRTVLSDGVP